MANEEETGPAAAGEPRTDAAATAPRRRGRNRRLATIGIGSAAVVLAGGGLLATQLNDADDSSQVAETTVMAPLDATESPAASPSVSGSAAAGATPSPSASKKTAEPVETPTAAAFKSKDPVKEVAKARAAAERDGYPVQHPKLPAADAAMGEVNERNTGNLKKDGATMRVVSARFDLSGQRELLWAGDPGKPVGDAKCTQTFQFANSAAPAERPNLLLCWRTSAEKSVVTVAVTRKGRPSESRSVAALEKEWAKLG